MNKHVTANPIVAGMPCAATVAADVARALAEDVGNGDLSAGLVDAHAVSEAELWTREDMVLAGRSWFDACVRALDPSACLEWDHAEAAQIHAGARLCQIHANARALLSSERTAMNFLQTLSGTATVTAAYVALTAGSATRILDTRKTLPGLRYAQKYAVKVGGGQNHRMGLFDAVLIKENHIIAAGNIATAIARARALAPGRMVEIEVESLDEYRQAVAAMPDRIMLDELSADELKQALIERTTGIELELSGGIEKQELSALCQLGVDYISIGALTKHVRAIDLSLRWKRSAPVNHRSRS